MTVFELVLALAEFPPDTRVVYVDHREYDAYRPGLSIDCAEFHPADAEPLFEDAMSVMVRLADPRKVSSPFDIESHRLDRYQEWRREHTAWQEEGRDKPWVLIS